MTDAVLEELNRAFGIAEQLHFHAGGGGLWMANISNAHAQATLALQGAQLLTYQPRGAQPVLWLSGAARYLRGKSVRGGVPVCWPWFGPHATDTSLPAHGFARNLDWQVTGSRSMDNGATELSLTLGGASAAVPAWPEGLQVKIIITVGPELRVDLVTYNSGSQPYRLTDALHTYFHVSDVRRVRVLGLDGSEYLDKVGGGQAVQSGAVTFAGEVDRIYLDTTADCVIEDPGLNRRIRVAKLGSRSTVVWNPWIEKAGRLGDLGPDGYLEMLCVETTNAGTDVVELAPGAGHQLQAVIGVEPLD